MSIMPEPCLRRSAPWRAADQRVLESISRPRRDEYLPGALGPGLSRGNLMRPRLLPVLIPVLLLITIVAINPAQASAQPLRDAFSKVKGSVVLVGVEERIVAPAPDQGLVSAAGFGSGVMISADGKVLTAAHVVQAADRVAVKFSSGQVVQARVISSAEAADLALLQLDSVPPGAAPAPLGDSDKVEVGDEVFIVGAPYGLANTLTVGHVGGRMPPECGPQGLPASEFFQTDAAINKGSSGSPMFNLRGEVVGIVSNILSQSGGFEGIGFAATAKMARLLLLDRKPFWSGVDGLLVRGELAHVLNLPQGSGYLVQRVAEGSPGARLGLRPGTVRVAIDGNGLLLGGDIILSVNGVEVADESHDRIYESVSKLKPGERLVVGVLRWGRVIELAATSEP